MKSTGSKQAPHHILRRCGRVRGFLHSLRRRSARLHRDMGVVIRESRLRTSASTRGRQRNIRRSSSRTGASTIGPSATTSAGVPARPRLRLPGRRRRCWGASHASSTRALSCPHAARISRRGTRGGSSRSSCRRLPGCSCRGAGRASAPGDSARCAGHPSALNGRHRLRIPAHRISSGNEKRHDRRSCRPSQLH